MGLRKKPYNEEKKGGKKEDSKRSKTSSSSDRSNKKPWADKGEKSRFGKKEGDSPSRYSRDKKPDSRRPLGDSRKSDKPTFSRGPKQGRENNRTAFADQSERPAGGRTAAYPRKRDNNEVKSSRSSTYKTAGRTPFSKRNEDGASRQTGVAGAPRSRGGFNRNNSEGSSYKPSNKRNASFDKQPTERPTRGRFSKNDDAQERSFRPDNTRYHEEAPRRGKTGRPYMVKGAKARDLKAKSDEMLESLTPEIVRLNRFISNAGICSRREADDLIAAGLVSVNGEVVTEMGYKVKPGDEVRYNKERLNWEQKVYLLMNKPKDFITTSDDPEGRKIIMDLIKEPRLPRVYPVGRLDRNTTGVILLTNDGELAQRLTHPKYNITKIYKAVLNKSFAAKDMQELSSNGVELEDGPIKPDVIGIPSASERNVVLIQIHSGRNRIIHRMFEALGYLVDKLDRIEFAGLDRKGLNRGEWRHMDEKEIKKLKKQVQLK